MSKNLSKKNAYLAMFSFLEDYYARTNSGEIGSLLSGMCLMTDGMPMDRAYWDEWERAVQKALDGGVDAGARGIGIGESRICRFTANEGLGRCVTSIQ